MNPFRKNTNNFSRDFSCKFDTMQYFHRWSRLKQCYKMSIWNFFYQLLLSLLFFKYFLPCCQHMFVVTLRVLLRFFLVRTRVSSDRKQLQNSYEQEVAR